MNLYAYVGGNPINAVDPWGLHTTPGPVTGTPCVYSCHPNEPHHPQKPAKPEAASCPARQDCYNKANSFFLKCNSGVTAVQAACIAGLTIGSEGFGFGASFGICSTAMAPKRAACLAMRQALIADCDKIPCNECSEGQ